MFKLHLDISLYFVPPMVDHGGGICVTREFELPFPPSEGLNLTGIVLNGTTLSEGYVIKEITWDVDRQVFLAQAGSVLCGFPLAVIPLELRSWIERGWYLGSYAHTYEKSDRRRTKVQEKPIICRWNWSDEEASREWERNKPRSRPESFSNLFKAIIREMAILYNNSAAAYAMDRTKMFFEDEQFEDTESLQAKKFKDALSLFHDMSSDQQYNWRDQIIRRYPHLEQFVIKRPRRTRRSASK